MSIASLWSSDLNKRPYRSIVTCKLLWPSKVCAVFGFRSVRFARYSALECAAAAEILLLCTVGGIDQRIPDNWATRMSKQVSRNFVSYHKSSALLVSARRHQGRAMKMAISHSGA